MAPWGRRNQSIGLSGSSFFCFRKFGLSGLSTIAENEIIMFFLTLLLTVLEFLGLSTPWLVAIVVLFLVLIYLEIVSNLMIYRSHDPWPWIWFGKNNSCLTDFKEKWSEYYGRLSFCVNNVLVFIIFCVLNTDIWVVKLMKIWHNWCWVTYIHIYIYMVEPKFRWHNEGSMLTLSPCRRIWNWNYLGYKTVIFETCAALKMGLDRSYSIMVWFGLVKSKMTG